MKLRVEYGKSHHCRHPKSILIECKISKYAKERVTQRFFFLFLHKPSTIRKGIRARTRKTNARGLLSCDVNYKLMCEMNEKKNAEWISKFQSVFARRSQFVSVSVSERVRVCVCLRVSFARSISVLPQKAVHIRWRAGWAATITHGPWLVCLKTCYMMSRCMYWALLWKCCWCVSVLLLLSSQCFRRILFFIYFLSLISCFRYAIRRYKLFKPPYYNRKTCCSCVSL